MSEPAGVTSHPLDPLAPGEIAEAARIIRESKGLAGTARFVIIENHEPPKDVVLGWQPGTTWDRQAFATLRETAEHATYEAVVSLTNGTLVSWTLIPNAQPPITFEEFLRSEELVRNDPRWQAAMRLRGVEDFSLAMIDKWASGYVAPGDEPGTRRIARPLTFVRSAEGDNGYAHPVEGLIVTVDMDSMTIVDVADHGVVALPESPGNYNPPTNDDPGYTDAANVPHYATERAPLKPILITQPEGSSVVMDGHGVEWGPWKLRVGYTPREGIVLHDIRYTDRSGSGEGRDRPVLYRASLSEMYVPYGDPAETHWNKNVFDEGEYGLGSLANALELGCDCVGEITYLDAWVNDQDGGAIQLPNAICIHEEDAGIGWKHTDFRNGRGQVRRNRRLVISFFATVGNYDYGFYWNLYLDGSIELEIKLTGIISTGALEEGAEPEYGTLVAPRLYGPNHQHFFSVRLDMQVDGQRNNIHELSSASEPAGPGNPWGNAWKQSRRQLASESEAQRLIDPSSARSWLVTSADTTNLVGGRPGYKLEPGANAVPFFLEGSQQSNRGQFATKHLWVTEYDPAERYAAGDYVAQQPVSGGITDYVAGDRSLVDTNLVLWYTIGVHHVVRTEDWPVMPVAKAGMHLKPVGFFDGNPMLDLPPEPMMHGDACAHDAGAHEHGSHEHGPHEHGPHDH
ncbi:primary-amine oxidase [soil metagenome]